MYSNRYPSYFFARMNAVKPSGVVSIVAFLSGNAFLGRALYPLSLYTWNIDSGLTVQVIHIPYIGH